MILYELTLLVDCRLTKRANRGGSACGVPSHVGRHALLPSVLSVVVFKVCSKSLFTSLSIDASTDLRALDV